MTLWNFLMFLAQDQTDIPHECFNRKLQYNWTHNVFEKAESQLSFALMDFKMNNWGGVLRRYF